MHQISIVTGVLAKLEAFFSSGIWPDFLFVQLDFLFGTFHNIMLYPIFFTPVMLIPHSELFGARQTFLPPLFIGSKLYPKFEFIH